MVRASMDPNAHESAEGEDPRLGVSLWLAAVLVFAVATRLVYGASKSLVLDEFHSYFHATRASFDLFLETLRADNHPPLSFLVIGMSRDAFGALLGGGEPPEWALRVPALVFGLLEVAIVAHMARRFVARGNAAVACVAAATVAASSLHFDYGTQARMYALHALAITTATYAVLRIVASDGGGPRHRVLLALAIATSFHTHYFGLQYLGGLLVVAGVASKRIEPLVAPTLAGAALCLPWALTGFREQLGHELAPGGDDASFVALLESFGHLFVHNVSLGGPVFEWAFLVGAFFLLVVASFGALGLVRDPETRTVGVVVATVAFVVPVASWALAQVLPRAGYTWHYVLPSTAAMAVLVGAGARAVTWRRVAIVGVAIEAALCVVHLFHPASEDFRGTVEYALAQAARPGDTRIVAVEWQPPLFPQGQPWDYYAPQLAESPPERAPMVEGAFHPVDFAPLLAADRVVVLRRSLPDEQPLLARLLAEFGEPNVEPFGYGLDVRVFER